MVIYVYNYKCENYRGIALEKTTYKVPTHIILQKLKPYVECKIGEYQNGFRENRSTMDGIFTLTMLNEKIWEYDKKIHYLFVDFQKLMIQFIETVCGRL